MAGNESLRSRTEEKRKKHADKKLKELESEVNKLKVILSLRKNVESLQDILVNALEWDFCPTEYKRRIAETLNLEFDEDEENKHIFDREICGRVDETFDGFEF